MLYVLKENYAVKKVYIEVMGCQMNKSDAERMYGMLEHLGYTETNEPKDADLLIILSDIDGLYDKDPHKYDDAVLIPIVEKIDDNKILKIAPEIIKNIQPEIPSQTE